MLFAFSIDGIRAQATAVDERQIFAHIAFLEEELVLPNFFGSEESRASREFGVSEVDASFYVGTKCIEDRGFRFQEGLCVYASKYTKRQKEEQ